MRKLNIQIKLAIGTYIAAIASIIGLLVTLLPLYSIVGDSNTSSVGVNARLDKAQATVDILLTAITLFIVVASILLVIGIHKSIKGNGHKF
jgi:hypothetical protein